MQSVIHQSQNRLYKQYICVVESDAINAIISLNDYIPII
jgi:hypothetical protein